MLTFGFLVIAVLSQAAFGREVINFDYGWRFHLGDPYLGDNDFAPMCPPDPFPTRLEGRFCDNLQRAMSASTEEECQADCCSQQMCSVWVFSSNSSSSWTAGCHIGQSDNCTETPGGWFGEKRAIPVAPPTPTGKTSRDYNDKNWTIVDLPHDGIIGGLYVLDGPEHNAYLVQNTTWYRKHFSLPEGWKGKSIWIYFEGIFRSSLIYFNGEFLNYHESGYTSFAVRLDNTKVFYGQGTENENVIAVRADAAGGSGWWYEGGGIYRHTYLVAASRQHLIPDGVYGAFDVNEESIKRYLAAEATFHGRAEVVNDGETAAEILVRFVLKDRDGQAVVKNTQALSLLSGQMTVVQSDIALRDVELWSATRPYMYTLETAVISSSSVVIDSFNTSVGARHSRWNPETGFYLNRVPFTWRGYCNHNDFTGVGVAVPERINLFRAQMMRAVGGNSWRMSHNPPAPHLLDILDRLGIVVWDETRDMANNTVLTADMREMVRRDRNHPSVMLWSFCNERSCLESDTKVGPVAATYKDIAKEEDPFRPVAANMNVGLMTTGLPISKEIEVQGLSHEKATVYDEIHEQLPDKPLIGSECCSCETQRGEDVANKTAKILGSFNGDCNREQTSYALSKKYASGTMVWTLFDYYGEPTPYGWPMVSSSFGSFDLSGIPKPSAFWYRAWWLYNVSNGSPEDVPVHPPPLPNPELPMESQPSSDFLVYIVQHWEPRAGEGNKERTIQVYTNAPFVELFVNGKSNGVRPVGDLGWAEWDNVVFSPGSIRAVAMTTNGETKSVVAESTVFTTGVPTALRLSVVVPSEDTGTGSALVLDGQDAGLVSASVVDSQGRVVHSASGKVTFRIISGPGKIIGVGNGNPACSQPNKVPYRDAYHGMARAVIQVTGDWASPPEHRRRLSQIDRDGGSVTRIVQEEDVADIPKEIVVEASYETFVGKVGIPITGKPLLHGVLSTAENWMN